MYKLSYQKQFRESLIFTLRRLVDVILPVSVSEVTERFSFRQGEIVEPSVTAMHNKRRNKKLRI